MAIPKERILVVESDTKISDLIARDSLRPLGYHVDVTDSASTAIRDIEKFAPDLIITNLYLPEITGKDLMMALKLQEIDVPIVIIAPRGHESDALQAFRLGAVNCLTFPIREAEVVNVVEESLRRQREQAGLMNYSQQLELVKGELKEHIRDLTEVFTIGKLAPTAVNQQALYEKITSAAARVAKADSAWMLVFDSNKQKYFLRAWLNADEDMQDRLNRPYEDSLSSVVVVSGKAVSVHGETLEPYQLPGAPGAVLAVPIKWKEEVIGMLAAARKEARAFTVNQQAMLELAADYASSLLENARRYQILEQRFYYLQQSSVYTAIDADLKNDLLRQASLEMRSPLKSLMENLELVLNQDERHLSHKQINALKELRDNADVLLDIADSMVRILQKDTSKTLEEINLNEIIHQIVNRYQAIAQVGRNSIRVELPSQPTMVKVFASQITKAIEGLMTNALKYSPPRAQITIKVEQKEALTMVTVIDQGEGIDQKLVDRLFEKKSSLFGEQARQFGGIGISLPMVKEIVAAHRGEIWVESERGQGFRISMSLPSSA